jgi:Uma2 family endonuclease
MADVTATATRPRLTYEELCRMPDDGNRYQLVEGEAFMTPSPDFGHQDLIKRLLYAFEDAIQDGSVVAFAPLDVVLSERTALQPDLLFIREENLGIIRRVVHGAPDLVVEVLSPSTAYLDRSLKLEAYARYRVPECWLIDRETRKIEIYRRDAKEGFYRLAAHLGAGDRATTPLLPGLSVDVAALFSDSGT